MKVLLQAASGADFERLWLQGISYGIAAMADEHLDVTQRGVIGVMKTWLTQWGLAPPAPDR